MSKLTQLKSSMAWLAPGDTIEVSQADLSAAIEETWEPYYSGKTTETFSLVGWMDEHHIARVTTGLADPIIFIKTGSQ